MNLLIVKKKLFLIIILSSFLINSFNLKDYGYAWDDYLMRYTGFVNLKYIIKKINPNIEEKYDSLKKIQNLNEWRDKYYGPSFETTAAIIEILSNNFETNKSSYENNSNNYYLRCFILIFLMHLSYFFFFKTSQHITKNNFLSTIGLLVLISYPRFFAEQHYNTRDLYLCGLAIMCIYFGSKILNKIKIKNIILFSLFCGIAISTRISSLIIPFSLIFLLLFKESFNLNKIIWGFVIILFVIFSTFINFPFLWENPLQNSLEVFQKLSNHSWRGNVLYFGKYYKSIELPWHYILSWYFLTTPITYSLIFLFTVIFAVRKIYDGGLSNIKKNIITHKYFYLNFGIFIFALFLIIIFQKTKYNGWRHSYFLFIFFLYSILYFVNTINLQKIKNFIYLILILTVSLNLHWIYRNHPYQNLYFNFIIKEPYKQFDMDWWGLTNIDILKYLLNYDKSKEIKIWAASGTSLEATKTLLTEDERKRIKVVKLESEANYILNNYINNQIDYSTKYLLIKEIKVSGNKVNSLYKIF